MANIRIKLSHYANSDVLKSLQNSILSFAMKTVSCKMASHFPSIVSQKTGYFSRIVGMTGHDESTVTYVINLKYPNLS